MTTEDLHQSNYAALYQIVGSLAVEAGVFETEQVERLLTDLNAMADGTRIDLTETHLPFAPEAPK